jgi:hypothetical protein
MLSRIIIASNKGCSAFKQNSSKQPKCLQERDGYTTALAEFLHGDSDGFLEEIHLKGELVQLQKEIAIYIEKLKKNLAVHNPGVPVDRQKERAYYQIDIERNIKAIENARNYIAFRKFRLSTLALSQQSATATLLEFQLAKLREKYKFLRSHVNQTKAEFAGKHPLDSLQTNEARIQRITFTATIARTVAHLPTKAKYLRSPEKHGSSLSFLIDQIGVLNARLIEIG